MSGASGRSRSDERRVEETGRGLMTLGKKPLLDFVLWVIGMVVETFPAQGEEKLQNSGRRESESDLNGAQLGLPRRQREEPCRMVWRA